MPGFQRGFDAPPGHSDGRGNFSLETRVLWDFVTHSLLVSRTMNSALKEQLAKLPKEVLATLDRHYFDADRLCELARRLTGEVQHSNYVTGKLEAPAEGDVATLPERETDEAQELEALGLEALRQGECAMAVLAGGMATRMGGVVKTLVEALPGQRFLDLRLNEATDLERRAGQRVPLWLMTSDATDQAINEALGSRRDEEYLQTFVQYLSVRLTPEGDIFYDSKGNPSLHAPGHGDLPDALKQSGLLQRFVERGGRYLMVTNIDNLGASLDPLLIGFHIRHGKQASCEVVEKVGSDRGGIPIRLDGKPVVLEEFRIPDTFDPASVNVFSTNTFFFNAKDLLELDMRWTYFTVQKKVEGNNTIQFERLLGELTSHMDTQFVKVPRTGKESRFLPVKDYDELDARQGEITLVARDRGMIE